MRDETRAAIRATIVRAFRECRTADETARAVRLLIGLTEQQARAVDDFGAFLEGIDVESLTDAEKERLRHGGLRPNKLGALGRTR